MFKYFSFQNILKPQNLKKQPVPEHKIDRSKKIIKWQTDRSRNNDFPQQLLQNVYNSPVGSAALKVWAEFVNGGGLLTGGETPINKDQTINDLNRLFSVDISHMEGVAYIQRYNSEGQKTERFHLPFEETRLGEPDGDNISRIYHNPYYGIKKSFDDKYTRWFYAYNDDPEHVKKQIEAHNNNKEHLDKDGNIVVKYPGQAFWFSIEKPLARVYPQPFYYSAINSFQVDAEIPLFHERNIKNNLLSSVLINMHGDPNKPAGPQSDSKDTTDKTLDQQETVGDVMDQHIKGFIEEKGGVFLNWALKEEERATIEAFPTNSHDNEFLNLQNNTIDHIAIGTQVPRILIGIATSGKLGDTQEVLNAVMVMQGRTEYMRQILKRIYEKNFDLDDGTIKRLNPFNLITDTVWGALSLEEQRTYVKENFNIGLIVKEPEKQKTDDPAQAAAQANLKGSVGGVQGILGIQQGVSAGLTTRESAISLLELIYGFSTDEANSLLGNPVEGAQNTEINALLNGS